jgi:catechol 2,3-dioxygenase
MTSEQSPNVEFKPRRLGHVNLTVSNLQSSVEFYNKVLGIEHVRWEPDIKAGFLSNGNTHHDVALIEAGVMEKEPVLNHLGWELENQVEQVEAYERAREAGVKIDFMAYHQISYGIYLSDPEGNGHEFYADAMTDWRVVMDPQRFDNMTSEWHPGDPAPHPQGMYPVSPEIRRVDGAIFQPERVARATFGVRDLEMMTRFFEDVGGLSTVGSNGDDGSVVLGGTLGLPDLTLVQVDDGQGEGLRQFSFEMAGQEDLDRAETEMEKAGISPESREDDEGKRSIFLEDPDGFRIEFFVDK